MSPIALSLFVLGIFLFAKYISSRRNDTLRYIPGPPSYNLLYGNLKEIWDSDNRTLQKWVQAYGRILKYKVLFRNERLHIVDLKAINHVLMHSYDYQKSEAARYLLGRVLGHGILITEGDKHKNQCKMMNPAFGNPQIRELTEVFLSKSIQLRDIWLSTVTATDSEDDVIDVVSWLSKTTLDVIGLAGFNYEFNALGENTNELSRAFSVMFSPQSSASRFLEIMQAMFPIMRHVPIPKVYRKDIETAQETMRRIGGEILQESKIALQGSGEREDNWGAKDLLSLLMRANMAKDLPDEQRMSDEDVLSRKLSTFFVAGHETSSTATAWTLFALSVDKRVQSKLREELLAVTTETPTMDELNNLTYLDHVIRETLRIHAPVGQTVRVAMKDGILPLEFPYTDTQGDIHDHVKISKGQTIVIPILQINRDPTLWGEDAAEFKPERWEHIPEQTNAIPAVWSHMLTFLAGPRGCIGYKFSVMEIKALIFTLIRGFEFDLAVPALDVGRTNDVAVQRPTVKTEKDKSKSNRLPMKISPVSI